MVRLNVDVCIDSSVEVPRVEIDGWEAGILAEEIPVGKGESTGCSKATERKGVIPCGKDPGSHVLKKVRISRRKTYILAEHVHRFSTWEHFQSLLR